MNPVDAFGTGGIPNLTRTLGRAAHELRSTALRATVYTLVWRWLALLAALFVLDLAFGLPAWLRWVALAGVIAFIVAGVAGIVRLARRMKIGEEWAARALEEGHPELDNALINAVQFARTLGSAPSEQRPLMERELARAESSVGAVSAQSAPNRAAEGRTLQRMIAFAALWALTAMLFWNGFQTIMPRLFAPWMDDITPPYSATHFDIRPRGATVRYGDSLEVSVQVTGQIPDTLYLMTRTAHSSWRRTPLDLSDENTYTATLDSLTEKTWFYAQASTGRSARYEIAIVGPPQLAGLNAAYTYPAYTIKPPLKEAVATQGIHGLAGTTVRLDIESNRRLAGGTLEVDTADAGAQQIPITPDPKLPNHGVATMTVTRPGTYKIALTADDGQANPSAGTGKIVLETDGRPNVWFSTPGQDLLVTPTMKVPLVADAEDDTTGIANLQLHRMINTAGDSPQGFPNVKPAPKVEDKAVMNMADLGVRPGDQISYYATAYDNRPGQPQIGESAVYTIKVVDQLEYEQALREQRQPSDLANQTNDIVAALQDLAAQQQALARRMKQLQQALAKHPGDEGAKKQLAEAQQEQKALQQRAKQLARALQAYAQSPSSSDLERAIKKQLGQVAGQLANAANSSMQHAQGGSPLQAAQSAQAAANALAKASQQVAQKVQPAIQHLAEIMPLYNDVAHFFQLLDAQGQLVLRARQYQDNPAQTAEDRAKLADLANQQAQVQDALKQLQQDLLDHAQQAQKDFPKAAASARRIAAEIGRRHIPNLMQAGRDKYQEWDGPQGYESSQSALTQMQAMVQQGSASQCQSQCKGELDIALQKLLGQRGLGNSLGQFGFGTGSGGPGSIGFGIGGTMMGQGSGEQAGGSVAQTPRAFDPSSALQKSLTGTGGPRKENHANKIAGAPAALSPANTEYMPNPSKKPLNAGDEDAGNYPPQYRKLIGDYFKSVANSSQPTH